jgi:hypothetical protein
MLHLQEVFTCTASSDVYVAHKQAHYSLLAVCMPMLTIHKSRCKLEACPGKAALTFQVRAGTGGDEAALFAGDLLRMYERAAALNGWKFEVSP